MSIIGKSTAFIKWKGKVFCQEFHVTDASRLPNLLSTDACFRMKVLQTCFTVTGKEVQNGRNIFFHKTTLKNGRRYGFHLSRKCKGVTTY